MPCSRQTHSLSRHLRRQHGAVLIVMLVIMMMGIATVLISSLSTTALKTARQETTVQALAQAKEALIGFSVKVLVSSSDTACAIPNPPFNTNPNCPRPGDLPCPDTNNDGQAETYCGSAAGNNQSQRLGRLPWKTLGLPDLRDGSGERLWYAVSNNFKNNTRTTCSNSNLTGCLNSDTPGTITVFAADGTLLNDGGASTGAVAIIIAPGDVLTRADQSTVQDRSSAGINNPQNYLDIALGKDNANFVDGSSTNGFIQGSIRDNNGNLILNDQLLVITQDNIMQPVQKRVAAEVKNCLIEYAAIPQNKSYYPWTAVRTIVSGTATYPDTSNLHFGRVPDQPFNDTRSDSCDDTDECDLGDPSEGMKNVWGTTCTLNNTNWWANWKEMVFYGLARSLRPHDLDHNHVCPSSTNCLTVNPLSTTNDKSFVVIVAGKKLTGQVRSSDADKSSQNNYLEGGNTDGTTPFEQSPSSTTFNDIVVFQ